MFSTATATIESAMSGSTTADGICTTPVTASASVSAWATVKALTCQRSGRHDGAASTSALMNSTWSNPRGRMCSRPSVTYVENTPACYRVRTGTRTAGTRRPAHRLPRRQPRTIAVPLTAMPPRLRTMTTRSQAGRAK